jgi:hypothetical protein
MGLNRRLNRNKGKGSHEQNPMDNFQQARPLFRTALAFILHLRRPLNTQELNYYYRVADQFLDQFEADLRALGEEDELQSPDWVMPSDE